MQYPSLGGEQVMLLCPTLTRKLCIHSNPLGPRRAWWLSNGEDLRGPIIAP
jgi:hypothetical protein